MGGMRRVLVTMVAAGLVLVGCGDDGDSSPPTGESLYRTHCAACHGGSGQGASGPALVGDDATPYTDEELAAVIADGIGSMPGFADRLEADEIDMIVGHLRTLQTDS